MTKQFWKPIFTTVILKVLLLAPLTSNASAYCTFEEVTNVRTGGNNDSSCYMSVKNGEIGVSQIKICENSDGSASDRNFAIATTALVAKKRIQIYSQSISSCDEITKWFKDVTLLTLLAD